MFCFVVRILVWLYWTLLCGSSPAIPSRWDIRLYSYGHPYWLRSNVGTYILAKLCFAAAFGVFVCRRTRLLWEQCRQRSQLKGYMIEVAAFVVCVMFFSLKLWPQLLCISFMLCGKHYATVVTIGTTLGFVMTLLPLPRIKLGWFRRMMKFGAEYAKEDDPGGVESNPAVPDPQFRPPPPPSPPPPPPRKPRKNDVSCDPERLKEPSCTRTGRVYNGKAKRSRQVSATMGGKIN